MKLSDVTGFILQSGLLGILLGLLISGVKYAKAYIDMKTAEATAKIRDASVKNAVSAAEDCVTTAVLELAQTVADDLKAKSADGKLTKAEAAEIKSDAAHKAAALMSDDVIHTVDTVFGDADTWIKSKIEAAVKKLKAA